VERASRPAAFDFEAGQHKSSGLVLGVQGAPAEWHHRSATKLESR
jgi:hypothetical protein